MAGRRVYLQITEELLKRLGHTHSADIQDFIAAIKQGPLWIKEQGICQKAFQTMDGWRVRPKPYPPYVGYLALFVLAAGLDGDFAPHSYYPRLRALLGESPDTGQYPSFSKMLKLWEDLEQWSRVDQSSQLGFFSVGSVGSWIHVGLPISQTLLSESERQMMPKIFVGASLDATSLPSRPQLADLLLHYGKTNLRKRTLQLLKAKDSSEERELHEALLEMVLEELQNWDGTFTLLERESAQTKIYGTLRLCCRIDRTAQRISVTLRCKTAHEFPEDGLIFREKSSSESFYCEEDSMGWSSELIRDSDGMKVDATQFNWVDGIRLRGSEKKWTVALKDSKIRIFVSGAEEGLPGLVEINQLSSNLPFYLMVYEKCHIEIEHWGTINCTGFEKIVMRSGLPNGWSLYHAKSVSSDEYIRDLYPILALSDKPRIEFKGGIRFSRSNEFFAFAPPQLLVGGIQGIFQISYNGTPLPNDEEEGIYTFPSIVETDKVLMVQVHQDNKLICQRSLVLKANFSYIHPLINKRFDRFGRLISEEYADSPGIAGAIVDKINVTPSPYSIPLSIVGERRIFLIGREPGQIVRFPIEPLPERWKPIWAIPMSREGRAVFCI
jgi:hypothetical protein